MTPAIAHEEEQNLWHSVYTTAGGWSKDGIFADHRSAAAPALAQESDTLVCVHRGARQGVEKNIPLRWTSHTPVDVKGLLAEVDEVKSRYRESLPAADRASLDADLAKATAAVDEARRWTPDADLGNGNLAFHTPAIAAYKGSIYAVYYRFWADGRGGLGTTCRPAVGTWSKVRKQRDDRGIGPGRWPGLAVYKDKLHLVFAVNATGEEPEGLEGGIVQHATLAEDDEWVPVQQGCGGEHLGVVNAGQREAAQAATMRPPGNYALTEHDGLLHLLYRKEYDLRLWHATYDGDTWSKAIALDGLTSRRGASIASYDGKLHAVYPSPDSDLLRHAVYQGGKWSKGEVIAGHESQHDPALISYAEADGSRSLILVHRGLNTYVPPAPKAHVPPKTNLTLHASVSSPKGKDYSASGGLTRAGHQITLYRTTSHEDGSQGIAARWTADVQYQRGPFWYDDDGSISGELRLRNIDDEGIGFLGAQSVQGDFSGGLYESTSLFENLAPGTYEVALVNGRKTRGYWSSVGPDRSANHAAAEIDLRSVRTTITITA
ncbi:hypothetical protein [Streptomyces tanashiensis]|uniref:hypothetical protein n=1 Tax=Streptomyces tanashiensis TaxID=67367 RepID=UPI00167F0CF3|nr:hypothetical protein [Streptomyces tanashiensis]GGY34413.1 hypothetical protein GCM10010299_46170 [Streptomyces tanashiensis]